MSKLLFTDSEWTMDLVQKTWDTIDSIAKTKYDLDYYPPSIEIVTASQMIDRCSTNAMPVFYNHWSFGKRAIAMEKEYRQGKSSLAYEVVINTNPSRAYIMEDNTMTMQMLVLAHSVCGHGSFFKNNYLFKQWTDADFIEDYLVFARNYVKECEDLYGTQEVERWLDSCHALAFNGIDKYPRTRIKKDKEKEAMRIARIEYEQKNYNEVMDKTIGHTKSKEKGNGKENNYPWPYPEENLLYFIEKNSPYIKDWQKEILRIVRKTSQYFYPQIQTKVMNEGWASFWHYQLIKDLLDEGYIDEGPYLEFLESHTSVVFQQPGTFQMNPYYLGFNMFRDIKRICTEPTEEDKEWFPDLVGQNWVDVITDIMENYRDESFISQFLSPKLIRDMRLLVLEDDCESNFFVASHIAETEDAEHVRIKLAETYSFDSQIPQIDIIGYNYKGDRTLHLLHIPYKDQVLNEAQAKEVMKHLKHLWGPYPVSLVSVNKDGDERNFRRVYE